MTRVNRAGYYRRNLSGLSGYKSFVPSPLPLEQKITLDDEMKDYTYSRVKEFASEIGIDAGIIVGRLQKDNEINFDELNGLKKQYDIS